MKRHLLEPWPDRIFSLLLKVSLDDWEIKAKIPSSGGHNGMMIASERLFFPFIPASLDLKTDMLSILYHNPVPYQRRPDFISTITQDGRYFFIISSGDEWNDTAIRPSTLYELKNGEIIKMASIPFTDGRFIESSKGKIWVFAEGKSGNIFKYDIATQTSSTMQHDMGHVVSLASQGDMLIWVNQDNYRYIPQSSNEKRPIPKHSLHVSDFNFTHESSHELPVGPIIHLSTQQRYTAGSMD